MKAAAVCSSHSPLLGYAELGAEVRDAVVGAAAAARLFAEEFDPDVAVVFFPDHYNGFFYDVMPAFCIGTAAEGIGDYGTAAGSLSVPEALAAEVAQRVLDSGVDVAVSHAMQVDHGAVQPLEMLFDTITDMPVIPVFINSVAPPFAPLTRVRALGAAVARALSDFDGRVLFVASGGLSHDPPVPRLAEAAEPVRAALLGGGRNLPADARAARQQRVIDTGAAFARGEADIMDLAPDWDLELMGLLAAGSWDVIDTWTPALMERAAGHSSHEVRTWIAAYAALAELGDFTVTSSFYRAIPELICGYGVTCVQSAAAN